MAVVGLVGGVRPLFDIDELSGITVPALRVPFSPERSPHIASAEDGARRYLRDGGLVRTEAARRRHETARLATLTGSTYPLASAADLRLVTEWISVNLVLDDLFDRTELGRDPDGIARWAGRVLAQLPVDPSATGDAEPVLWAYRDLWRRTAPRLSRQWRLRFAEHVREFLDVCRWEAANRRADRIPELDEYIAMRGRALYPYLDLIELTTGAERAADVAAPELERLHQVVSDVDLWTNDLFSFVQEAQRGDPHNLVTVYAAAHACPAAEAVDRVAGMVQERIDESVRLSDHITAAGAGAAGLPADGLDAHLRALRGWVAGQLAWRYTTRRFDPDGTR